VAKRRKVPNPLALAVLGTVAERPMHPYEMASMIRSRGKESSIKIKWGTLYTVVDNLDKHGLIEATETVREGRRPERTVYTITEAGRAELHDWLRELVGVPEKEHRRFEAGLSLVGFLGPDETAALLRQRLDALDAQLAELRADLAEWGKEVPRLFLVEAEYDLAMRQAEADWTRSILRELVEGTMPGIAQWRTAFETGEVPPEWAELAAAEAAGADPEEAPD
jgi:DNA-binding PadR family transcriptional regulator